MIGYARSARESLYGDDGAMGVFKSRENKNSSWKYPYHPWTASVLRTGPGPVNQNGLGCFIPCRASNAIRTIGMSEPLGSSPRWLLFFLSAAVREISEMFYLVPGSGLEPLRHCCREILSLLCLPIPPPGLIGRHIFIVGLVPYWSIFTSASHWTNSSATASCVALPPASMQSTTLDL